MLIIGGSGSGKTNALLNLVNHQPDMDKIYLYVKDLYEATYNLYLINKLEKVGPKVFIEYSTDIQDVRKNIRMKRKVIIVFDDAIADTISDKKVNSVVSQHLKNLKFQLLLLYNHIFIL